jgi:hypothetical protein
LVGVLKMEQREFKHLRGGSTLTDFAKRLITIRDQSPEIKIRNPPKVFFSGYAIWGAAIALMSFGWYKIIVGINERR